MVGKNNSFYSGVLLSGLVGAILIVVIISFFSGQLLLSPYKSNNVYDSDYFYGPFQRLYSFSNYQYNSIDFDGFKDQDGNEPGIASYVIAYGGDYLNEVTCSQAVDFFEDYCVDKYTLMEKITPDCSIHQCCPKLDELKVDCKVWCFEETGGDGQCASDGQIPNSPRNEEIVIPSRCKCTFK